MRPGRGRSASRLKYRPRSPSRPTPSSKTEPNVWIEVGNEEIQVVATEATGAERDQLFDRQKAEAPQFAEYQAKTERPIPVIVLTRRG
jgi:hypothetical protein